MIVIMLIFILVLMFELMLVLTLMFVLMLMFTLIVMIMKVTWTKNFEGCQPMTGTTHRQYRLLSLTFLKTACKWKRLTTCVVRNTLKENHKTENIDKIEGTTWFMYLGYKFFVFKIIFDASYRSISLSFYCKL